MSYANCCISNMSSSPNSLAPRPFQLQASSGSLLPSSQYYNSSSHRLSSSSTVLHLSTAEDIAELQAIFEEDKLLNASGNHFPKSKGSSGNLVNIKDRLKKHLSIELKIHKHHSRSSVRTSDEGIERRAELRRIRQRRIQQELSNEFRYDSDAKSLPTIAGVDFTSGDNGIHSVVMLGSVSSVTGFSGTLTPSPSSSSPISPYLKE